MLKKLKNYLKISDKLHTAAQPDYDQFKLIKDSGVEIIINLAEIDSPGAIENESQLVVENMMDYINIPVDFKQPASAELESFFNIMIHSTSKTVLVHCAYNWRVSCFIYLYRIIKLGISEEEAKRDMLKIWEPNKTWQFFIETNLSKQNHKIK